ncbi:hypothetical protein BDL97_06G112400 [Sphagnum fallax]|nr:hypothetical protein BDL97_06G112400 [Sphagnum fallax]
MATRQDLPYLLDSKSECPPLFNGTTRLYYFPVSPFSQCVKIALNYKGLDEIECLPISLNDKPTWYVEKVYPVGKEEDKKEAAAKLLKYRSTFVEAWLKALGLHDATPALLEEVLAPIFNHLENALRNYANEGPFILGKFSMVDIAYVPFIERAEISFSNANYDIMAGRPKLAKWIEAMNTIDAYTSTKLETIGAVYIWEAIVRTT